MSEITYPVIAPLIICSEAANDVQSLTVTVSTGIEYLYAFKTDTPISVTAIRWDMGATATGKTNAGIYTLAGALVTGSDSGQQVNTASATNTFSYGGSPVYLPPGQYFIAIACTNGTDTYSGKTLANAYSTSNHRRATNSVSGTALNAATGGYTTTTVCIACSLVLSGGLA
jgi:hypothetical protein